MFRKTLILILLSFISYNLHANEIIDRFNKAVKSKQIIQYSTMINMNDESKGLNILNCKCAFKMAPDDTLIGAYYNFSSDESINIYNNNEYLKYYPKIYGDKIVNLKLKAKKPKEFSDRTIEMNGQPLKAHSVVKSPIVYVFSLIELMKDLNNFENRYTQIILSDTLINGYQTSRIRYTITDTKLNGENVLYYYLVAFDKKTDLPVYFLKYTTKQQTEVFYSDYIFNNNDNDYLFTRKAFPSDYKIMEDPVRIERKSLKIGSIVPDWSLKSIYDKEIKLKDLRGKPTLLIFSEIGCAPCMIATPDLNEIANTYQNINVISIYSKDNRESLKKYSEKMKIVYDILDNSLEVADSYFVYGYPTFFLIDSGGILKYSRSGYSTSMRKRLEDEINKVLNK
jgi:peroxiredoxin